LGYKETEDAFIESEKLVIKQDKEAMQKSFNLFKKQADVSSKLQNRLETIANKYKTITGVGKEQTMLANESYKTIRQLFLNEFRHTGGKTSIQGEIKRLEGTDGLASRYPKEVTEFLPSFESNQTTIKRLVFLNKELQFDMQDLMAKTAKSLQQTGATDKAEALLELRKNLREIAKPGPSSKNKEYEMESVKKMTEAANAIRRLVGGEERVIQKLEGAEGPASQYPKNVKRLGLAKGGLGLKRQSSEEGLAPYGFRNSGEGVKGKGYFGELATKEGEVATELSSEFEYKGKTVEHPLLVPTLTKGEVDHLLAGKEPTAKIYDKAEGWAKQRLEQGKSPFAAPDELRMPAPDTETKYRRGGLASKRA
jgi:hypothetical protein